MKNIITRLILSIIPIAMLMVTACNKDDKDTNPPKITLLGLNPTIAGQGLDYVDAGATAYDDEDGNISDKIIVDNEVNTADTGTYYVRYNVQDDAGNNAKESIRTVNVIFF